MFRRRRLSRPMWQDGEMVEFGLIYIGGHQHRAPRESGDEGGRHAAVRGVVVGLDSEGKN